MATASSSWMPAQGRHDVRIGSSFAKALKARKGQPPQRNKNLPERDFYSLRYNHKPASIDPAKPGTLEVNPGREVTAVRVERPTAHNNEVVVFKGEEKPAKEWDCVLIYDEATQTFTLEKLDSLVNLNFDGKAQPRTRPTASPPAASTSTQAPQRSPARTAADELEAQLEGSRLDTPDDDDGDADADGEPDPSFLPARTEVVVEELEDGEEEEEEDGEVPLARTVQLKKTTTTRPVQPKTAPPPIPPPPPTQEREPASQSTKNRPTQATVKKSAQAGTKARTSAAQPKPSRAAKPPAPSPTTAAPTKRAAASSAAERRLPADDPEDFEIRGPIAPTVSTMTKRGGGGAASVPPPPPPAAAQQPSFSLALPTASGPDPLAHNQGLYNGAAESDDEWDEILAQPDRSHTSSHHHHHGASQVSSSLMITIEDEADDGLDFLERELLGEDEPMVDVDGDGDGDADVDEEGDEDMEELLLEEVVPTLRPGGSGAGAGPMSMNQFVGGSIAVEDEDDEYSSSEESDED